MALVFRPPKLVLSAQKLRIDSSHPLANEIFDCLVWNAGVPINLAAPSADTTITNSPTYVMTEMGPAGYAVGGSDFEVPDHGVIVAGDFSIRILSRIATWPGGFTTLVDKGSGGRELSIFFDGSGNMSFLGVGTNSVGSTIATGMTAGSIWDYVLVRRGTVVEAYVNGISKGTQSGVTGVNGAFCPMSFGVNTSTGGNNADAQYITAQTWRRGLSADEVSMLAADPFGFLVPDEGEWPSLFISGVTPPVSTLYSLINVG